MSNFIDLVQENPPTEEHQIPLRLKMYAPFYVRNLGRASVLNSFSIFFLFLVLKVS